MFYHKYSFEISLQKLKDGIKDSDFLVSDKNCTHRLIGLKYKSSVDFAPTLTIICSRHEMSVAKQIAFSFGKKIYSDTSLSALLYSQYQVGEEINPSDFKPVARLYAKFMKKPHL